MGAILARRLLDKGRTKYLAFVRVQETLYGASRTTSTAA